MKDRVKIESGEETCLLDLINPAGMFRDGKRLQPWTTKNLLPTSGKLIPEFDRRRNIRDMFSKKPSIPVTTSSLETSSNENAIDEPSPPGLSSQPAVPYHDSADLAPSSPVGGSGRTNGVAAKRGHEAPLSMAKRVKAATQTSNSSETSKGQKSLKGFFAPKSILRPESQSDGADDRDDSQEAVSTREALYAPISGPVLASSLNDAPMSPTKSQDADNDKFVDPIASKDSWGKLFVKPAAPKCEHAEPCKTMLTKKSGVNCGRSFWMCARPLGPSGNKEKGTQWRCSTFIWASDWNGIG